jgi:hypothetical protein
MKPTNVILPGFLTVLGQPSAILGTIEVLADGLASFTKQDYIPPSKKRSKTR